MRAVCPIPGERYLLRVHNASNRRVEVVVSVDGRDVVDGRPASLEKRGYLVLPHSDLAIDGFRLPQESVAAFRFSSVSRSYAARMGDDRDVGVIGVAIFVEEPRRWAPPPSSELGAAPLAGADQRREAEQRSKAGSATGSVERGDELASRSQERPGFGI
jgi:hypothetical protein